MSAISFAKKAFIHEKPFSSISSWVDILTGAGYDDEAYDGIPELVDSINLQAAGPAEASRAIRKKIKHGDAHQQYRALVILKALVENCGSKFQTTFADGQLTDALKHLATDPNTNPQVKKKLIFVVTSWHTQFRNDPYMAFVNSLYKLCRPEQRQSSQANAEYMTQLEDKRKEKEEAKAKAKQEKEEAKERERKKREEDERMRLKEKNKKKRPPFNFEQEKPNIFNSIATASQASSNLVNAITLVNPETDSLQSNERVQECLNAAKQTRKQVVRYIQLVENEDLIGTLIEANDRIIAAIEMYDKLITANTTSSQAEVTEAVQAGLAAARISPPEGELSKLQGKQRAAVARAKGSFRGKPVAVDDGSVYSDLQDLNFGALGTSSNNLQPPIRPSSHGPDNEDEGGYQGGSLSEFSDYESSDENTHGASSSATYGRRRPYVEVSDNSDDEAATIGVRGTAVSAHGKKQTGPLIDMEDPFADPFADEVAVGPAKHW